MKVRILSDLHLEFGEFSLVGNDYDLVILAGDIHVKDKAIEWIQANIAATVPVIYVLGNHEFYGKAYPKLVTELKSKTEGSNIHVLEDDMVTINNVNFFGARLWTDFEVYGDPRVAGYHCQQIMSDFKKIRTLPNYSLLRSVDAVNIHKRSIQWLDSQLKRHCDEKNIVITHHGPSEQSVQESYKNDLSTAAYVSNLDGFILENKPSYWIHGHLHNSVDYLIGDCRVICNPRGYYPIELNPEFDERCTITV